MSGLKITRRGNIWQAHGTVAGERIRQSLGTGDRARAEELRAHLEARLWARHTYGEAAVRTFEEAVLRYIEQGGDRRFLAPLLQHFRGRAVGSIKPGEIREAALTLYPRATPATRNRQAIVPARAVINHAHSLGWCQAIKVQLFPVAKSRKHQPVDRAWLDAFMAQADGDGLPHLSAIVLFMNQTAARRSEAVRLTGEYVDLEERVAVLARTKTDEWSVRHLTPELALRIAALEPAAGAPVFRYTDPSAVTRAMGRVCSRAGIARRGTHAAGRHSFGTNVMRLPGARVKAAMEAGGWKSARLFIETYVHDADAGREIAEKLAAATGPIGTDPAQLIPAKRYRFGKKR